MKTIISLAAALLLAACGGGGGNNPGPGDPPTVQVPASPTLASVTLQGPDRARLAWTDNASNEQGYTIERALGADGVWQSVANTPVDTHLFEDRGLEPGNRYRWRVSAYNTAGRSGYSNDATLEVPMPPADARPPLPPYELTALPSGQGAARLSWQDAADNEQGFTVERAEGAAGPFVVRSSRAADSRSFDDTGLAPGISYRWRVRAFNASGVSAYGNVATLNVPAVGPPTAPSGLAAAVQGSGSSVAVQLNWVDASNDERGFRVERATAGAAFALLVELPAGATSHRDTPVPPGTELRYRVRALGATADSAYSDVAAVATPGAPLHTVRVQLSGDGSGSVSSVAPALNCGTQCTASAPEGTTVSLTALAQAGSSFDGWTGCELPNGTLCSLTLDANTTVEARFNRVPPARINASAAPLISATGNYTLSWTATGTSGPWQVQTAPDTAFAAPLSETVVAGSAPFQRAYTGRADGTHCHRVRGQNMPAGSFSNPVCVTVSRPAVTGVLQVNNLTPYTLVSMKIDGLEQIGAGNVLAAGNSGTQALTPGTFNYELGVGYLADPGVLFQTRGQTTIVAGQSTRLDYRLQAIDLLSGFGAYRDWVGEYWTFPNGTARLGVARFRFMRTGAWELWDQGVKIASGPRLADSSWTALNGIRFKTCSTCAEGAAVQPFASFVMSNGPADWRVIRYQAVGTQ